VFYTALVFTPDAAAAHLGVSLWHTVQYHAFVYHAQVQRFPDASRPGLLPWLLAEGKRWRYFVFLSLLAFGVFAFPAHLTRVFGGELTMALVGRGLRTGQHGRAAEQLTIQPSLDLSLG